MKITGQTRSSSIFATIIAIAFLLFSSALDAKTTKDINHKGWSGKYPKLQKVDWKPIASKCPQCQKMVDQYNDVAQQLLEAKHRVEYWRQVNKRREKGKSTPFWPGKGDINDFEAKAVSANLELFDLQAKELAIFKAKIVKLQSQLAYLASSIAACEKSACNVKKPTKFKKLKAVAADIAPISARDTLSEHGIAWNGPYSTKCQPCYEYPQRLNALPHWLTKTTLKLENAKTDLELAKITEAANKIKVEVLKYKHPYTKDVAKAKTKVAALEKEIESYKAAFNLWIKELAICVKRYCTAKTVKDDNIDYAVGQEVALTNCPKPKAHESIEIGANDDIGSSANFKEKAKNKLVGGAANLLTGALGLGGGGGGKAEPNIYKDPVKKKRKLRIRDKKAKRDFYVGATFTPNGLLVSNNIKKAPGKGTFHEIYLENQRGWRLRPIALFMYEIWRDWKLTVSWTRDTYVNGQHVKHESGGWVESGRELIAKGEETIYAEVPLWEQLGFNTAVSGAKSLGVLFPITPEMLATEPIDLVIHVTVPKSDPVVTHPYLVRLSLDSKGRVVAEQIESTHASNTINCDDKKLLPPVPLQGSAVPDSPAAPADTNPSNSETANGGDASSNQSQKPSTGGEPSAQNKEPSAQNKEPSAQNEKPPAQNGEPSAENEKPSTQDGTSDGNNPPAQEPPSATDKNQTNGDDTQNDDGDSTTTDKPDKESGAVPPASSIKMDPCKEDCAKLKAAADAAADAAKTKRAEADLAQGEADRQADIASELEKEADKAEEMARDIPRDDHAIINGKKYTTADTEYRVLLQNKINAAHKAGEISNEEHERQTKANTNAHAQAERLKNLERLGKAAKEARGIAEVARTAAQRLQAEANKAKSEAEAAEAKAVKALDAYKECLKKAKAECEKQKAEAARLEAERKKAEEKRKAEAAAAAAAKKRKEEQAREKARRAEEVRKERERLLALIKKLGLISTELSEVPSLWEKLPDVLETPVGMLLEQTAAVPVPTDTLKALGGLYGLAATMMDPCTKAGKEKTIKRLRKMKHPKTGKNYNFDQALKEADDMCGVLNDIKGRLYALKNK